MYDIPPAMIARMAGHTVDVEPYEQTVAWTYPQLKWDPLPAIQDYAAYTGSLDQLDARFVDSSKAPRFILRQPSSITIDGRIAAFDPPATQLAIQCNYRQVSANASWQLLERSHDRCGSPQRMTTVSARFGEEMHVPAAAPGQMVVASFDLHLSLLWHLLDRAYKGPMILVQVNGVALGNRFIVGTAGSLHGLRPAASLGYSPPFAPPAIDSMTFVCHGGVPCPSRVTVTYSSVPFR